MALLVAQTLRYGTREGWKVAAAPVLTDAPIVAVSVLVLAQLAGRAKLMGVVALLGGAYLLWLAWGSLRFRPARTQAWQDAPGSVRKALATNLLNPHVYLFWTAVGAPLTVEAWRREPAWAAAYVAGFYGALVGSKLVMASLIGRSRAALSGPGSVWAMRACGALLALVAAWLLRDGIRLLS
jgi:threonine/homoserine/homoserine lactone efflux protein